MKFLAMFLRVHFAIVAEVILIAPFMSNLTGELCHNAIEYIGFPDFLGRSDDVRDVR